METRIGTCQNCGEQDYRDFLAKVDNKILCNACWNDKMSTMESECIEGE